MLRRGPAPGRLLASGSHLEARAPLSMGPHTSEIDRVQTVQLSGSGFESLFWTGVMTLEDLSGTKDSDACQASTGSVILGTGLLALDIVVFRENRSAATCFLGGTCGNVLAILSALGWRSYPIGRPDANHPACVFLPDELALWGIRRELLHLAPTSAVPVIVQRNRADAAGGFQHPFSFCCPRCRRNLPRFQSVRLDSARLGQRVVLDGASGFSGGSVWGYGRGRGLDQCGR